MKAYKVTRTETYNGLEHNVSAMAKDPWRVFYRVDVKTEFTVDGGPGLAFETLLHASEFASGCWNEKVLAIWECDVEQADVRVDYLAHWNRTSIWKDFWMLPYCDYEPEFDGDKDWGSMGFILAPQGTIACKSIELKRRVPC